jgi:hypothetical protein
MIVAITSLRVGRLGIDPATGFAGEVSLRSDDGAIGLWLDIFEDVSADAELLAGVPAVIDSFPELLDAAQASLAVATQEGTQVLEFVESHATEFENPGLAAALAHVRSAEDVVRLLRPKSLVFHRGDAGDLEWWIDFSLPSERSDEVLAVRFDTSGSVTTIDWES